MQSNIRIGLVDTQAMLREGLVSMLNSYEDIEVVGQGNSLDDAHYICDVYTPDVLITDFSEAEDKGIHVLAKLRKEFPKTKLLILTSLSNSHLIHDTMRIGILGYWFKTASLAELVAAIYNVNRDVPSLAPDAIRTLLHSLAAPPELGYDLTEREREILLWMAKGYSNREIANTLCISYSTVKNHVSKVLSKLEVSNRVEAVTYALKMKVGSKALAASKQ